MPAMNAPILLALDAMSGDHGHGIVVEAALRALDEHRRLSLILVGDETVLRKALAAHRHIDDPRLTIQHASEVVAMDEAPSKALRGKKDSSMRVAVDLVKQKRAQAAVSAGNTGALMAIAKFVLKTLPGIDRPAIISPLPTVKGATHVLDLGCTDLGVEAELLRLHRRRWHLPASGRCRGLRWLRRQCRAESG